MIIGLTGPKLSGKSSLAKLLRDKLGYTINSFAAPIKLIEHTLLKYQNCPDDLADRMCYGDLKDEPSAYLDGKTSRDFQIMIGEQCKVLFGRDYWVNAWKRHVLSNKQHNIVINDLRFLNEAKTIHDLRGKIIKIDRDGYGPSRHISEREYLYINMDYTLANDSTLEALFDKFMELTL